MVGRSLTPRRATLADFRAPSGELIDQGIALAFAEGASFTGEPVVELQGHGSPVALALLLNAAVTHGARIAQPGEFTERSFVSGVMDLAQAEAVADLIASSSEAAVRGAAQSLKGVFSERIQALSEQMLQLRVYLEADIDFPDEEVDVLAGDEVLNRLVELTSALEQLIGESEQGVRLATGATIAIVGRPNAGKSSLLNRWSGAETAIVTEIPGTTRDLLNVDVVLRGLAVRLVDTAGLRETDDPVEREGVRRALNQLADADLVIHLRDLAAPDAQVPADWLAAASEVIEVWNKADLVADAPDGAISARSGVGVDALTERVVRQLGHVPDGSAFTARQRHVDALRSALAAVSAATPLAQAREHAELIAEEVRQAHRALGEIVGEVTSDALLGEIFSSFCIGK